MAKRFPRCLTVEDALIKREDAKARHKKAKREESPRPLLTYVRFFEKKDGEQDEFRQRAEEIFGKGTESPKAVSSYRDLMVNLFEKGADEKPRKKSKKKSSGKPPGNRQPGRKKRDREMREERNDARERKTA